MRTNKKLFTVMLSRRICSWVDGTKYCSVILALRLYHIVHVIAVVHREFKTWQVPLPTWPPNRYNHRLALTAINIPLASLCTSGSAALAHFKDHLRKLLSNIL